MEQGGLFRREAVESQSVTVGHVIAHTPPGFFSVAGFMAILLAFGFLLLVFFQVPRTVQVDGWIQPAAGYIHLLARSNGVVSSLNVVERDRVEAGQVIGRIIAQESEDGAISLDQRIVDHFAERRDLLQTAFRLAEQEAQDRSAALAAEISEVQAEIAALDQQIQIQTDVIEISEGQLAQALELARRGTGSELQIQTRRRAFLVARAEGARLEGERSRLSARNVTLQDRSRADASAALQNQTLLQDQEIELAILALEAQRRLGYNLVSPRSGQVVSVLRVEGATVETGDRIITVLPEYERLEVHALLPVYALGSVQPGHRIILRLDAAAGSGNSIRLEGAILSISAAPMASHDFDSPLSPDGRFHRIIAQLDPLEDRRSNLVEPGMTLRASITYRRDPLWRLLFPDQS